MKLLNATLVVLALCAVARADDVIEILEPTMLATLERRTAKVVARVESVAPIMSVTLEVAGSGTWPTPVSMTAVQGRPGLFQAEIAVPTRSQLMLRVRLRTAGEDRFSPSVKVRAMRDLRSTEVPAPGETMTRAQVAATTCDGKPYVIDARGPVLVHFYSAWDDCKQEVEWLESLRKQHGARGLTVVGVASVAPAHYEAWQRYLKQLGSTCVNLPDPEGAIGKAFFDHVPFATGSQLDATVTYVLKDGKVAGADYVDRAYIGKLESGTVLEALTSLGR